MTASLELVLVRPKEDGNVGAVARLARNFGATRLVLVAPRARLGAEARRRAMGGLPLLRTLRVVDRFPEALGEADYVVGSTDLSTGRSTAFLRRSISPERLGELLRSMDGRVALVFGPEDNGLAREELSQCDVLVHIPARRDFPTLNLSHAAGIILHAIHRARGADLPDTTPAPEVIELSGKEKELFLGRLNELMRKVGYPRHKRKGLQLLFRRILGRATPSEGELRMLLGFLRTIERHTNGVHER